MRSTALRCRAPPSNGTCRSDGKVGVFGAAAQHAAFGQASRPDGATAVGVVVLERAFLGEHWDYVVRPREGALTLRVTASPMDDIPVGASAWLEFEPRQMALIA